MAIGGSTQHTAATQEWTKGLSARGTTQRVCDGLWRTQTLANAGGARGKAAWASQTALQIAKDDDFRAVSRSCGGNRLSSWSLSSSQWVSGTADVLLRLPGTDRVVMVALIKTVSAPARRRLETSSAGHRQGIDNPFGGTHMALPQLLDRRHRRLASGETQSFVLAVAVQWPIQQYRGSLGIIRPCGPTCTETENRGGGGS